MKQRLFRYIILFCFFSVLSASSLAAEINAVLDWSDKRLLGTTVSGKVTKVHVRPGMQVNTGDVLVELDQRYFQTRKKKSRARMEAARLLMEEAKREQERAIELFDRTVLSVSERQQADIGLASAKAAFASARAEYEEAVLDIEYSKIIAPYDGVVLHVAAAAGEVVVNENQSTVLTGIARSDEMLVQALLTDEQVSRLQMGQDVEVAFRGHWTSGKVHSLSLQASATDMKTGRYAVSIRLKVDKNSFARAGEASAIRLPE